ncbi:MAG: hypothetical protein Q8N05_01710 [Bacteroidota bacterium]|nr:hypothetical protein [Bacteroidota bacterium]
MKIFKLTLFITVLFLSACSGKKAKNDLTKENIRGRVSKITESKYTGVEKFGEIQKDSLLSQFIYKFDRKGMRIYNKASDDARWKLVYDDMHNLIELNSYNEDGSLDYKSIHEYDEMGNQIEGNIYRSDGSLIAKQTYKFDKKGYKIEETYVNFSIYKTPGAGSGWKYTYKYDEKGNMIEKIWYYSSGNIGSITTYKYDEYDKTGNWIKKAEFKDGKLESVTERVFEYY